MLSRVRIPFTTLWRRTPNRIHLKRKRRDDPWSEFEEKDQPKNFDGRLTLVVVPAHPEKLNATLGEWLAKRLQENRNTIRFLLPQKGTAGLYGDKELLVLARAVYLAMQWKKTDPVYGELQRKFHGELTARLKGRFDRFAVMTEWNFADPAKGRFEELSHAAQGDKIPEAVDTLIKETVFEPEEFEEHVLLLAENSASVGKLLKDLREPRPGGKRCIPWLGGTEVKERVVAMCAHGQIAISVRGLELLQARPDETPHDACAASSAPARHLDDTTLHKPNAVVASGGKIPVTVAPPGVAGGGVAGGLLFGDDADDTATSTGSDGPTNLFDRGATTPVKTSHTANPTSGLNLLGQIESWGVGPATPLTNVTIKVSKMTGAQLQKLLKTLPDGLTYGLDLEKEAT